MEIPISRPYITEEEVEAVSEVLRSGYISNGPKTREFEETYASYIGVKHAIGTVNGTAALEVAIKAIGLKEGDEVITTPFSFIASSNCILYSGGKPIFTDIDPKTYNLDPDRVNEAITNKTKAILLVYLYGQPCEMDAFKEIASDNRLYLIEDASQAHGADYKGKRVGGFGDISTFSFYATKNMTTGEGGMILTDDDEIARKARLLVDHGQVSKYNHIMLGYNFRMNDIQASIGLVQLRKLDLLNGKRIDNARYYDKHLSHIDGVRTPFKPRYVRHVYHQYVLWVEGRESLMKYLDKEGIQTAIHYPTPIYRQPLYRRLGYNMTLENSDEAAEHVLSIPVHPLLSREDLNRVANKIIEYYEEG
jgi:perosamine synthetase